MRSYEFFKKKTGIVYSLIVCKWKLLRFEVDYENRKLTKPLIPIKRVRVFDLKLERISYPSFCYCRKNKKIK